MTRELTSTDLPRLRTITLTHGLAAGMISAAGQWALLLPFLPAQDGYKRVFVNLRINIVSLTCLPGYPVPHSLMPRSQRARYLDTGSSRHNRNSRC